MKRHSLLPVIGLVAMISCGPNTAPSSVSLTDTPAPAPTTGTISGRVIDATTGEPIAGASVSTSPPAGSAITGIDGSYTIVNVAPGPYFMMATSETHASGNVQVMVAAGRTTTADLHLVSEPTVTPTPTATPTINPTPTPTPTPLPQLAGSGGGVIATGSLVWGYSLHVSNADGSQWADLAGYDQTQYIWAAVDFTWSPDGRWLVYGLAERKDEYQANRYTGSGDLYKVSVDGTTTINLTNHPSSDSYPAWSPDGTRIAFISDRDGAQDLYLMDTDGSNQTRLTTNMAVTTESHCLGSDSPSWSPDGKRIAFLAADDIYIVNTDGGGLTQLTNTWGNSDPNWSPDGQAIAFVSNRDGNREIYVMSPDGSGQTNLTSNPADEWGPDWSPNSRRIAFTSDRNCCENPTDMRSEIHVMNADGSGLIRLSKYTGEFGFDFAPDWSPDGSRIAFIMQGWEAEMDFVVMHADGSGRVSFDYDTTGPCPRLAWRP